MKVARRGVGVHIAPFFSVLLLCSSYAQLEKISLGSSLLASQVSAARDDPKIKLLLLCGS